MDKISPPTPDLSRKLLHPQSPEIHSKNTPTPLKQKHLTANWLYSSFSTPQPPNYSSR
jgi:hypothetical protein